MKSHHRHDVCRKKRFFACPPQFLKILLLIAVMTIPVVASNGTMEAESEGSIMAPLATKSLLLDGVTVDNLLVVVGERGHILVSHDAGEQWRQIQVPTRVMLTAVCFADKNTGWAVGHGMTILRTQDGAETWEKVFEAPEDDRPFLDVWCDNPHRVLAFGAYGTIAETNDGGDTWDLIVDSWEEKYIFEEDDYHLNQMARSKTGKCYLAAEAGMLYRSEDDGRTWSALPSPYEGSFYGILPLDGDSVLAMGLRGHLFRSEDAGETWTEIETGTTALLNQGIVLNDGSIVVVGLGGAVLRSTDGGHHFSLLQQADRLGISAIIQADNSKMIVMGESGVRQLVLPESSNASPTETK